MLEQYLSKFEKNEEGLYKLYDRFSFDEFFRVLLNNCFEREEALDFILSNCALSALIFEERIYNKYYLRISCEEKISPDLIALRDEYFREIIAKKVSYLIEKQQHMHNSNEF